MIRVLGAPHPPVPRLMRALAERGVPFDEPGPARIDRLPPGSIVVVGPGDAPALLGALPGAGPSVPRLRLLVTSFVGAHPDARSETLQQLWTLEEAARATGHDVLTLRLAPLVGPDAPLWRMLRERPRLPRGGRMMLNPVLESDALETLERSVDGRAAWEGWYDVAGREVVTLAELAERAHEAPAVPSGGGAWEPPLDVLASQRPCDPEPWIRHFGIEPGRLADLAHGQVA